MSEVLTSGEDGAKRFAELHIHAPVDYDMYIEEMLEQWRENAEDAAEGQRPIRPMWLRRNGDDYNEFAAHIDYLMPMTDGAVYVAAIDISSDGGPPEVQVWLPSENSSGEPVIATEEPYCLDSLARAIEFAESTVMSVRQ